jgi:arabinose-5-phosphate isomerase
MTVQDRMRQIMAAEAAAISAVEINDAYESALEALYICEGKIVTTGMGKAGLVARKLAVTLASTGTPAVFVHPGVAAHGDLGMIANGVCNVAFYTIG